MDHPDHILQELHTGVAAALQRTEERMSHVQRQLAGWPALKSAAVTNAEDEVEAGWGRLQDQAAAIAAGVDDDLARVQQSLGTFLQQGRDLQASLRPTA